MSNFALITCLDENHETEPEEKPNIRQGLVSRLINFVKARFLKTVVNVENGPSEIEAEIIKIELYDDTFAYFITLPYEPEKIIKNTSKISEFMYGFISENHIISCILTSELKNRLLGDWISDQVYDGNLIYKSLLPDILRRICYNRGIKISDLDITIIHGKSDPELHSFLWVLSPLTKYITVITDRKDDLENEINSIYEESGLSIGLSGDYKAVLKNASMVINFGDFRSINNSKLNPKCLIINYNFLDSAGIIKENTVVNGIEVFLPVRLMQKIDKKIFKYFSINELVEIILIHKLGYEKILKDDYEILKKISREFNNDGYKINRLKGRRNLLFFEDI